MNIKRVAIDNNIINWTTFQGNEQTILSDTQKHNDYDAIERLFQLQEDGTIILVAVDQIDRELSRTSDNKKREKLKQTMLMCKEKFFLTRFELVTKSKNAVYAKGKSGINLGEGAYWITKDNIRRIEAYISAGQTIDEKVDLEVLATVAIAGVRVFVTVDYVLLSNDKIKEFVKHQDGIHIYSPSEFVNKLIKTG